MHRIAATSLLLGLMALMTACVIAPGDGRREGYYDREHNRWYHENSWHACEEHDEHCR
jgi:hypothetical protein